MTRGLPICGLVGAADLSEPRPVPLKERENWILVPRARFPALLKIHGTLDYHYCTGVLVGQYYVLTTGTCVEVLGRKPQVFASGQGVQDGGLEDGNKVSCA